MTDCRKQFRMACWLAAAVFVSAFLLRLPFIGTESFWLDEVTTATEIQKSWKDLTLSRISQTHSPVYFWFLKALGLEDSGPFLLRFPSVVFSALAAVFLVFPVSILISFRAGVAVGFLTVFSPLYIDYGQEARPNAMTLMFISLAFGGALGVFKYPRLASRRSAKTGRKGSRVLNWYWISLVTGAMGAILTLLGGVLAVLALSFAPLLDERTRGNRRFLFVWYGKFLSIFAVLAFIVVMLTPAVSKRAGQYWTQPFRFLDVFDWPRWILTGKIPFASGAAEYYSGGIIAVVFVAVITAGLIRSKFGRFKAPAIALGLGIPLILSVISLHTNVMITRYFLNVLPALFLLASFGAIYFCRTRPVLTTVFAIIVVLQGLDASLVRYKEDWRGAAEYLAQADSAGGTVVAYPPDIADIIRLHVKWQNANNLRVVTLSAVHKSRNTEELLDHLKREGRVYLVYRRFRSSELELEKLKTGRFSCGSNPGPVAFLFLSDETAKETSELFENCEVFPLPVRK